MNAKPLSYAVHGEGELCLICHLIEGNVPERERVGVALDAEGRHRITKRGHVEHVAGQLSIGEALS